MSTVTTRPNIVILIADDLGYGDLGAYGATMIPTPEIDRLASGGMRFLDMHASAAVCTPSRYGLLTGRYCWRTWLKRSVLGGFGAPLIEREVDTLAAVLKRGGYTTAAIGKWHLGLDWFTEEGTPLGSISRDGWDLDGFDVDYRRPFERGPVDCGFDYWYGAAASLDMPPYCFLENRRASRIPTREKAPYQPQQRRGLMSDDWTDEEIDLRYEDRACETVRRFHRLSPDDPFFLYVALSAPHRPCIPPPAARGRSSAGSRGDMITVVDSVVGNLVEVLEKTGRLENTLLIVTSDHGARLTDIDGRDYGHAANGVLRGQKGDIYEGGHRVPCVASWPQVIEPGTTATEPLMLPDLAATCIDLAGESRRTSTFQDGRSFRSLLYGCPQDDPLHDTLIHHSKDGMFAVRSGPWKLILGLGSGGFTEPTRIEPEPGEPWGQLYNLFEDPREQRDLFTSRPDIVELLQAESPL